MELGGAPRDRREEAMGDLRVLPDEVICSILPLLSYREVGRLACVSRENIQNDDDGSHSRMLHFDGFNSMFLYKRMYRCYTKLDGFYMDSGNVERREDISLEEFQLRYDGKKPVLLKGLADTWPARKKWTIDGLLKNYGETSFRISQRSAKKITMKFKDYALYMEQQHDEDPLYVFDDKFGEVTPSLLKDYDVPHLFHEDFFNVLETDKRPPFRWVIIGPQRSGASWHVDPALTSAWNTLLCGRKRWALYPPGRVPAGVTVDVNEDDGDVNIETPTSLQWWLDYYPFLSDEEKPIECTQLPGETIYVPSGWWHCVLNLENTVAVTQNFVNSKNFEFVCLDMAPGYRHKGVCRAGYIALDGERHEEAKNQFFSNEVSLDSNELTSKGKGLGMHKCEDSEYSDGIKCCQRWHNEFPYEIKFLSTFLDADRDHYNSIWSSSNCIGQREMRDWLWKLWNARSEMRELIWKGACLSLNAGKWFECVSQICRFHSLPAPTEGEKLPIGTGSNPVYLVADNVIKIYVEGGLEASLFGLGTELEFYKLVSTVGCTLKDHIPNILGSGIISYDNGSYKILAWDGNGFPDESSHCSIMKKNMNTMSPFGAWSRKLFEYDNARTQRSESTCAAESTKVWPYVITKRCRGNILAELRESLSWEDSLNLASFLGEQLHNLHLLPLPPLSDSTLSSIWQRMENSCAVKAIDVDKDDSRCATAWMLFLKSLEVRKEDASNRLMKWGHPIPSSLIEKANTYLDDFEKFLLRNQYKACSWIHSDIMDDNIYMESLAQHTPDSCHKEIVSIEGNIQNGGSTSWQPSYILDFGNLTIGDPILDIIPIHLDVFRGDPRLLKQLLHSYKLPLWRTSSEHKPSENSMQLSYLAMCYCILHEDNVLGAIFSQWEELRDAKSWEQVEERVWGDLNNYAGSA